jgi:hypothetical protein
LNLLNYLGMSEYPLSNYLSLAYSLYVYNEIHLSPSRQRKGSRIALHTT